MNTDVPKILTHTQELSFLKSQGFAINPYNQYARNLDEVWDIQDKLYREKTELNYQIDGLVVKVNDQKVVEIADVVGKTPRAYCAIKFEAEEVATNINDITWQVGRTGKITPVAEFDSVEIAGTVVKRASLHNYKEVLEMELHQRDTIVIRKAGEIIPEVVSVLKNVRSDNAVQFALPNSCPRCNTEVNYSETGIDIFCPNSLNCPAQIVGRLTYFTQRTIANITGLSDKNLQRFIDNFGVKDITDLYNLPFEEIQSIEGFGEKSIDNLKNSIQQSSPILDYRFLAGLCIEGVGIEVARLICANLEAESEKELAE